MIDKTLSFLLGELNSFLETTFPNNEPHAVLSNLSNSDGSAPPEIQNRVILTLANIERETAAVSRDSIPQNGDSRIQTSSPLNLNVYFLLSANFPSDLSQSLRFLSAVLGYFQAKPVFTPQNSVNFPHGLQRLAVEMVNLNITDLQNLWASLGAKYLPSVFYKARIVSVSEGWVRQRVPVIKGTEAAM